MKALTGPEVLQLHTIAKGDKRLDRRDRIIVTSIARVGRIEMKTLATVTGLKDHGKIRERINRLTSPEFGYLPAAVKR